MDAFTVLINEIQSLKKEILSLREQNISLYNELARQHFILNNAINLSDSQKLGIYLTRLAGMQTAEFIVDNMPKVKSFDNKHDYFKYVLSHTESVSEGGDFCGIRSFSRREHKFYFIDFTRQNYLRL